MLELLGALRQLIMAPARANDSVHEEDYLVGRGVNATRITAKGNGDVNPVGSNKTGDGRAANRRTDILFISSGTSGTK